MNNPPMVDVIKKFNLKPLWSHDYLVEFYCSSEILPNNIIGSKFDGDRPLFNWAYYLLPEQAICPFHLHLADESWQYCLGGPLELFIIYPDNGKLERCIIGPEIFNNQNFIHITQRNVWFAAKTLKGAEYTLITHLVSPGFFPQDKIKGYYEDLVALFPQHQELIRELAWPHNWDENL